MNHDRPGITDEERLRLALSSEAHRGAPQPVGLDEVTTRARRIRRRRTTLAALSTAAVVALAVPAGMAITNPSGSPDEPPVAGDSRTEVPDRLVRLDMLADAEPGGDPAAVPLLRGRTIVSPSGHEVEVPGKGTPRSLTALGDQWLVLVDEGEGSYTLDAVSADGQLLRTAPAQSAPVVSDDGTVAAYVARSGDIQGLTTDGTGLLLAGADDVGEGAAIAAVQGSDDCQRSPGCTVTVNAGEGGVRVVGPEGQVDATSGFVSVDDASADRVLGTVSVTDDGSCSALRDDSGQLWRTCVNSFGGLSPDGALASGYPAYTDGIGPSSVSIVDMADGRELVRVARTGMDDSHARDVVWESDTAVLMTIWDGQDQSWRIVRVHVDGTYEQVESGIPGSMDESPVHLATR